MVVAGVVVVVVTVAVSEKGRANVLSTKATTVAVVVTGDCSSEGLQEGLIG